MRFIDVIVENSPVKEAKLFSPSQKAAEKPDSGITIQTKNINGQIFNSHLSTVLNP